MLDFAHGLWSCPSILLNCSAYTAAVEEGSADTAPIHILQSLPRHLHQTRDRSSRHNRTLGIRSTPSPPRHPFLEKTYSNTRTATTHVFFNLCVTPRGTIFALSARNRGNLTRFSPAPRIFLGTSNSRDRGRIRWNRARAHLSRINTF